MARQLHIIVVCTGNSCRSPMAEGFLKNMLHGREDMAVSSAGTAALPGSGATAEAVMAARELGADISGHVARQVDHGLASQADLILTMTRTQAQWLKNRFPQACAKIFTLGELAQNDEAPDVPDPIGGSMADYRQTAADLHALLKKAYAPMMDKLLIPTNEQTEGKE